MASLYRVREGPEMENAVVLDYNFQNSTASNIHVGCQILEAVIQII